MRLIDVFRIALRMLRTNLLRSILTILGIGVAIMLIVMLIGLGYGLQQIAIGSIVQSKALLSVDVNPLPEQGRPITFDVLSEIKQLPGAKEVSPVINAGGELRVRDKLVSVAITAASQNFLDMDGIQLTRGHSFEDGKLEVIVSPEVLQLAELQPEEVLNLETRLNYNDPNNQNQSAFLEHLKIVGITEAAETPTIYLPYGLFVKDNTTPLSSIKVVGQDRAAVVKLQEAISQKGFQVETLLETLDQARKIFNWVTIGLTMFGLIALVVASIGMFNTLTIALLERTREIGIMKAIGVTDITVKRLFLAEAAIIGLAGGVSGIVMGLATDYSLSYFLNRVTIHFGGLPVQLFNYPPGFLLGMVLFPMVLALGTGLYPAIRAARLNPLTALRYE